MMRARVLACLWVLVLLCSANDALAYHTERDHVLSDNAYLLPRADCQLGIYRLDCGVHERLTLGTYHVPWLFGVPNASGKIGLLSSAKWALSLKPGFLLIDLKRAKALGGDSQALFLIIPAELAVSRNFKNRYDLSFALVYTHVAVSGEYKPADFSGVLAVSNLQLTSTFEWRLTRVTALLLHYRSLIFQNLAASAKSTFALDDYTTAEVQASANSSLLNVKNGSSLTVSGVWSWETYNLRFGLGYGNWSLPAVNLVVPSKMLIVDFDFYVRF